MATTVIKLGQGTITRVAMPPIGSTTFPDPITVTVGGTAAAKAATSITITAIPANKQSIPAGTYLGFVAPTTGAVVIAQLTADLKSGDTTASVVALSEAVAAGSTAAYPLRLSGRTAANIGRDGNRTETIDFDSEGFATGLTSSIAQTIELSGNYSPLDAGFNTMEYAFNEFQPVYFEIELTPVSAAYSKGKIYKGMASITSLPIDIPADGIMTGNISLAVNGLITVVPDVPKA